MTDDELVENVDRETAWYWFKLGFGASGEGYNAERMNDYESYISEDFEEVWEDD